MLYFLIVIEIRLRVLAQCRGFISNHIAKGKRNQRQHHVWPHKNSSAYRPYHNVSIDRNEKHAPIKRWHENQIWSIAYIYIYRTCHCASFVPIYWSSVAWENTTASCRSGGGKFSILVSDKKVAKRCFTFAFASLLPCAWVSWYAHTFYVTWGLLFLLHVIVSIIGYFGREEWPQYWRPKNTCPFNKIYVFNIPIIISDAETKSKQQMTRCSCLELFLKHIFPF